MRFFRGDPFPISKSCISDIREVETLLCEISLNSLDTPSITSNSSVSPDKHICQDKVHITEAIDVLQSTNLESHVTDRPEICNLNFIKCQLENYNIPKKRRRYNVITQILALKAHLISPTCYRYLQNLACISLPHSNTLDKLYSSLGLEHEFITYLAKVTSGFSMEQKKHHCPNGRNSCKSRHLVQGWKIYGTSLNPEDPTKTVFAIMISSLYKKWSCIVRFLPCSSISAEKKFPVIKSCIIDIENCGLRVHVICTDNYPLNVSLFKLFSPIGTLQTQSPHPYDDNRKLLLTFDFVHILKTIRNNWLIQKDYNKSFVYPKFDDINLDDTIDFQINFASFEDIRVLYGSER